MAEQEDTEVFLALNTAATATTSSVAQVPATGTIATLTKDGLANAFANVEDQDTPVENVIMRAVDYRDIRGNAGGWTGNDFDPMTRHELLKTGYAGDLWGAAIRLSKKQTAGRVFVCGSPEFLGVISVRIDLDQERVPCERELAA